MTKQELIQQALNRISEVGSEISRKGGSLPPDLARVAGALAAMRQAHGGSLPPPSNGEQVAAAALPVPMDLPPDLQPNWDIFWSYFTAINQRFGWPNRDQYLFMAEIAATLTGNAGAALTNPAGGANNYAPIDSPHFTGTVYINSQAVTFTTWAPYINPASGQNNYAPLDKPVFTTSLTSQGTTTLTGAATAPTPTAGDSSTNIATTAWVMSAIASGGGLPTNNPTFTGTLTGPTLTLTTGWTGVTSGTNAATGNVGEFNSTGPTTYTFTASATTANVYTASIAAGEWDVWSSATVTTAGTVTVLALGLSTTSATLPTGGNGLDYRGGQPVVNATFHTGRVRFNFSAATNVYVVGQATYTGAPTISYMLFWKRTR